MTDDYDNSQESGDASEYPAPPFAGRPWLKPLLLFAIALAAGALASGLWLRWHPKPATLAPSETVVASAPDHRPLPAPMTGGTTNLQAPASAAPDAPHIVSATPEADASPAPEAASPAAAGSTADTGQQTPASPSEVAQENGDSEPQVLPHRPPEYPIVELRARAEGDVLLKVSIDAQGNVQDVLVAASSGTRELDYAAMAAVRTWRYKPAMHDGQAVAAMIEVPVDFKLDPQD